jgi:hypothetical protein
VTQFKDFEELVDPLILPIGGKAYTIPAVSYEDGIKFNLAINPTATEAQMISDPEFMTMFLGPALEEMIADKVSAPAINRAAMTALADFQRGRAVAEVMWETGADPKALIDYVASHAPNRKARRSKSSAKATTTKPPASTSGTKPPQA